MNLRTEALRGGAFLAGRHAASLVIHLLGVTLLTRAIGPHAYGLYVGALGVQTYLWSVAQAGLIVFLIRREGELKVEEYHQAFSLLLLIGGSLSLLVVIGLPAAEGWMHIAEFAPAGRALALVLPLQLVALVPLARLERNLDYRQVAPAELLGYVCFYVVALSLAHRGLGAWAPVGGYWAQQTVVAALFFRAAKFRPRLHWNARLVREMLTYGVSYSGANWIWQLRELVNPLVVGRFAGADAVAYVALTVRLVDALSFLKGVGWRVSLSVLGKLQGSYSRMVNAVSDGMRLQILVLGPVLVGFGLVSPWAITRLFGGGWITVTQLYPFVALSYLTHSAFQLQSSALYVVKRISRVSLFHVVHLALFAGSALVLVPRFGPIGYGWSEIVALLGYAVLHAQMVRSIGAPEYRLAGLWWAALVSILFWQQLGWWSMVAPLMAVAWPGTVRELKKYAINFAGLRHQVTSEPAS